MEQLLKRPYELSLWGEETIYLVEHGPENDRKVEEIPNTIEVGLTNPKILNVYVHEKKLAKIGAHNLKTPIRAIEPVLKRKINGAHELTFQIYSRFFDEEIEDFRLNPFLSLLSNERKVKLKYDDIWYEFIIKDCQESSENYIFTYTCKEAFTDELAKTGYTLEFATDLENNMGTITTLAERILKGSDWSVGDSDLIKQTNRESLYYYTADGTEELVSLENWVNTEGESKEVGTSPTAEEIRGKKLYLFSSDYIAESQTAQVIWIPEEEPLGDDDGVILNGYRFNCKITNWDDFEAVLSQNYLGEKLIAHPETKFIPSIDKYCGLYKKKLSPDGNNEGDEDKEYYAFSEIEYTAMSEVEEMLSNGSGFITTNGWVGENNSTVTIGETEGTLTLKFVGDTNNPGSIINTGFYGNRNKFTDVGLVKGDVFSVLLKPVQGNISGNLKAKIIFEKLVTKESEEGESGTNAGTVTGTNAGTVTGAGNKVEVESISFISPSFVKQNEGDLKDKGYWLASITITSSISYNDILEGSLSFKLESPTGELTISEAKVFKEVRDGDGKLIVPDLRQDLNSIIKTKYYVIDKAEIDERVGIYTLQDLAIKESLYEVAFKDAYEVVYTKNYEKVKSITGSKSNRFNLIQNLCEGFECWARLEVGHNELGHVTYEYKKVLESKPDGDNSDSNSGPGVSDDIPVASEDGRVYYCARVKNPDVKEDSHFKYCQKDTPNVDLYVREVAKKVVFKQFIGQDNPVGFRYGINLKSIRRSINSDQIVTKMYVEPNINQYAENGICSLQNSVLNPSGENFLYNFNYYVQQGVLSAARLNDDLYDEYRGIGLYKKLKKWNKKAEPLIEKQVALSLSLTKLKSRFTVFDNLIISAQSQLDSALAELSTELGLNKTDAEGVVSAENITSNMYAHYKKALVSGESSSNSGSTTGTTGATESSDATKDETDTTDGMNFMGYVLKPEGFTNSANEVYLALSDYIKSLILKRDNYSKTIEDYSTKRENIKIQSAATETKLNNTQNELNLIATQKEALNEEFFKKYSNFIREGSWTSSEHIEPDLYYADSEVVLRASAFPKIEYSINVLEISQIEGYDIYKFDLGDKTYVEDTEFFGWDSKGRPYKEEIVVTELSSNLDDASKNTIKVQNYKNQFESLFQRVTAAVQSLQYYEGSYKRAAKILTDDGTVDGVLLEKSLLKDSNILKIKGQNVLVDNEGITITEPEHSNNQVRIVAGGILMSQDGGATWLTGITGNGVNAQSITTGVLNTNLIKIYSGETPTFMWDSDGITAFKTSETDDIRKKVVSDENCYIKFNQEGLMGINKNSNDEPFFSLTWDGLRIRMKGEGSKTVIHTGDNESYFKVMDNGDAELTGSIIIGENVITRGSFQVHNQKGDSPDWVPVGYMGAATGKNNSESDRVTYGVALSTGGNTITFEETDAPYVIVTESGARMTHGVWTTTSDNKGKTDETEGQKYMCTLYVAKESNNKFFPHVVLQNGANRIKVEREKISLIFGGSAGITINKDGIWLYGGPGGIHYTNPPEN